MNDIIISPCSVGDIPDLINLATVAYRQHCSFLWHDGGEAYMAKHFSDRSYRTAIKDPSTSFYMIYFQSNLVGYLKLNFNAALSGYQPGECLELERLYLLNEVTGKGVGQEVVNFTLNLGRAKRYSVVSLKVMDSCSKVVRFYEKAGFRKCGKLILDMPLIKEEYRTMHVMKQELPVVGSKTKAA